ncbi:hypothetical protein MMC21_000982 [Puttea exsequens]|nr:hypothetical protein [Puttea exsequens]
MPRERPHLSITLPRNFTFHYTEGEEPKTPEREIPAPVPQSPPRATTFRYKRRTRPSVGALFQNGIDPVVSNDVPIPTIEPPTVNEPFRPLIQHRATEPTDGYLAPALAPKFMTLPRTPSPQLRQASDHWNPISNKDIGESLSRPMSSCSLLSDSSDDSNGSLTSYPAGDGSCTSPESDAPDPFKFASIRKGKAKHWAALAQNEGAFQNEQKSKKNYVKWTVEMDQHLWSTYHVYLQDPTVTPFKMLPGVAPPLGVCHRVAREARRTWRGGRTPIKKGPVLMSPLRFGTELSISTTNQNSAPESPDTIRATRSGSNTPTKSTQSRHPPWPKSGSSTRRRLRHLCKRKPSIAPHYQRLLQSRSPSPFSSSSPRASHRPQSRLSEVASPIHQHSPSFNTRDIQLSLTTSTAVSMQPNGPLSQLALGKTSDEWFNEPPVPWASPSAIPSDILTTVETTEGHEESSLQSPRLGSPFGHHTWGPSRSRQRIRPSASRIQSSDGMTLGPSLRSPAKLHDTFPYPGVPKRRALHQLEDELSPGGSSRRQDILENLLSGGRHRRVRSRGFSLGDMHPTPLENLFTPPNTADETPTGQSTAASSSPTEPNPPTPTQPRRLASPFSGIAPRPTRTRHLASASLGGYEPFTSIGETLSQSMDISPPPSNFPKSQGQQAFNQF